MTFIEFYTKMCKSYDEDIFRTGKEIYIVRIFMSRAYWNQIISTLTHEFAHNVSYTMGEVTPKSIQLCGIDVTLVHEDDFLVFHSISKPLLFDSYKKKNL